jgi:mevalonate pyrophosphate decarboxylase
MKGFEWLDTVNSIESVCNNLGNEYDRLDEIICNGEATETEKEMFEKLLDMMDDVIEMKFKIKELENMASK